MTRLPPTVLVDLNQLMISDFKEPGNIDRLAAEIAESHGSLHPIVVWDNVIVDGNRRALAFQKAGLGMAYARVVHNLDEAVDAMLPSLNHPWLATSNTWMYWGRLLAALTDLDSPNFAQRTGSGGARKIVPEESAGKNGSYFTRTVAPLMNCSAQTVGRWRKVWNIAAHDPDENQRALAWEQVCRVESGEIQITTAYNIAMGVGRDLAVLPRARPNTVDVSKLNKIQAQQRDLLYTQLATVTGAVSSLAGLAPQPQFGADIVVWRRQINVARTLLVQLNRQLTVLEDTT